MAPPGAAPRTVRVTEAAPLPDPSRRGDQRDCAARCPASEGTPSRRHRAQYSNAPPGPDLGIRPSGPGGAGVARPDLGIRPSGRATPPSGRDGWFRDGPKSARPRPPLRTRSAPREAGERDPWCNEPKLSGTPSPPQWRGPARSQEHPAYGPTRRAGAPARPIPHPEPEETTQPPEGRGGNHGTPGGAGGRNPQPARAGSKPPPDGAVPPGV